MNKFLDLHFRLSLLWVFAILHGKQNFAAASDPCPDPNQLYPCWCEDYISYGNYTTESTSTTTSATAAPTTTVSPTTTYISTSTENQRRRRRLKYDFAPSNGVVTQDLHYIIVTCYNTNNSHVLEEAIWRGLRRRWVDKLVINSYNPEGADALVHLPNALLTNMRVTQFEIWDTLLAGDFINYGSPFEGQNQSIIWFSAKHCSLGGILSYSDIGTVNTMGLNKLIRLKGVDLSWNHLAYIRQAAFYNPPANLTTIILSQNNIRVIESRSFINIVKLRHVDFSHNLLETLQRSVFASPAKNLEHIDLSWNRVMSLPKDFFSNMTALKLVNISNNYIYSLPSTPWASIWRHLQVIDVSGNFIECDCSLTWLLPIDSEYTSNWTTTPSTRPQRQTILGSCSYFQYNSYPKHYALSSLTNSSLNC